MVERRHADRRFARLAALLFAALLGLTAAATAMAAAAAAETARSDRALRTGPASPARSAGEAAQTDPRDLPGPEAWRDPARWQRLRLHMSRFDVLRILGEPGKVTRYYAFERWEYPDALGRRVNFDERGRLIAWGPYAR